MTGNWLRGGERIRQHMYTVRNRDRCPPPPVSVGLQEADTKTGREATLRVNEVVAQLQKSEIMCTVGSRHHLREP